MTFDLAATVLAMLNPVIESDPDKLQAWADNLVLAAIAAQRLGHQDQCLRLMDRAGYLLRLAERV